MCAVGCTRERIDSGAAGGVMQVVAPRARGACRREAPPRAVRNRAAPAAAATAFAASREPCRRPRTEHLGGFRYGKQAPQLAPADDTPAETAPRRALTHL
eukprot:gene2118-18520_t